MSTDREPLPSDLTTAHAMILAERVARQRAEALVSAAALEIERLKLLLARMRRERFGQSSERGARLIEQLELQLAELEEGLAEEEAAAEIATPPPERAERSGRTRRPARRPLPENLPRERIVYPAPCACPKCGGPVRKLGEDVTESLECEPRRWKVVEHVREKVSCRACEAVSQPPAPLASDLARPGGAAPAGARAGGEVRAAPAADPAECDLRPRRGGDQRLDHGRLGGCCGCQPDALGRGDPGARLRGRAAARRRHHGPGAGQGADQDRPLVGLLRLPIIYETVAQG